MKSRLFVLLLTCSFSFLYPQPDSTRYSKKSKIVLIDTTKIAKVDSTKKSTSKEVVLGSIVALVVLYLILGPMTKK